MYAIHEEEISRSPESIIQSAMSAADVAADLDADLDAAETDGWARHALAASGFGDSGCVRGDRFPT